MINIGIFFFVLFWGIGLIMDLLIKKRLKALYPEIHAQLFAPSITEHNIKYSLEFMNFILRSSRWTKIEDEKLVLCFQVARVAFILMSGLMGSFVLFIFVALIYSALTGQL